METFFCQLLPLCFSMVDHLPPDLPLSPHRSSSITSIDLLSGPPPCCPVCRCSNKTLELLRRVDDAYDNLVTITAHLKYIYSKFKQQDCGFLHHK